MSAPYRADRTPASPASDDPHARSHRLPFAPPTAISVIIDLLRLCRRIEGSFGRRAVEGVDANQGFIGRPSRSCTRQPSCRTSEQKHAIKSGSTRQVPLFTLRQACQYLHLILKIVPCRFDRVYGAPKHCWIFEVISRQSVYFFRHPQIVNTIFLARGATPFIFVTKT